MKALHESTNGEFSPSTLQMNFQKNVIVFSLENLMLHLLFRSSNVVDGNWGEWSDWSKCKRKKQKRYRKCDSPAPDPAHGGRACVGSGEQIQKCKKTKRDFKVNSGRGIRVKEK